MPSPQALVTFVSMLFLLLVATRVGFGLRPVVCTAIALALAVAIAWLVDTQVPDDDPEAEDDITQEAESESSRGT